ncbi:kinase-like domain-containing protein [Mycena floridula]|nr:kinase-like domain-containing protein [Mycena floridula]
MEDLDISAKVKRNGNHYFAYGEFSDIYMGSLSKSSGSKEVVLKFLRGIKRDGLEQFVKDLRREGAIWRQLKHENIAEFYGLALTLGPMPALVLDYYPNGNIIAYLRQQKASNAERLSLVKDIANGLKYLHLHNPVVVHGDIRSANVFVTAEGHAVLADFGLAFIIHSSEFTTAKTAGNSRWTAPELMSGEEETTLSTSTDVFAFGMTIIEIYTEQHPFNDIKNDATVLFSVIANKRPAIPDNIKESESLTKLVQSCWDKDPLKRPTASSICRSLHLIGAPSNSWLYGILPWSLIRWFWD